MTANGHVNGSVEDLVHTGHLLGRALHVSSAHLCCDGFALLLCDGCEALCLEKLDASALVSEVGLETTEDDWRRRAEVEDLGIPLWRVSDWF